MAKKDNPYSLTDQQVLFAKIYHKNGCKNAYQAALDAGYSETYAKADSYKLLEITGQYLDELKKETSKQIEKEKQKNIDFLISVRDTDITDYLNFKNASKEGEMEYFVPMMKDLKKLPKELRLLVKSIEQTSNGIKLLFFDKMKAVQMINLMGGFNATKKVDVTSDGEKVKSVFKIGGKEIEFE